MDASPPPPPPAPHRRLLASRSLPMGLGPCPRCPHASLGQLHREEWESVSVVCEVPASLQRRAVDSLRHHFYPEGGWGWIICAAGFLVHLLTSGMQLGFGLLYLYAMHHLGEAHLTDIAWVGSVSLAASLGAAPSVVALCRRRSTRLAAVLGGLVMALACLFASFAHQLHQLLLSYGVLLGVGAGLARETSSLMLSHYFRRRREFVEMVVQAGAGVGIALFSVLYKEAVGKLGWRLGMQAVTVLLCLAFFLGTVYRSASMYHPQRRAIQHLKNQRRRSCKGAQGTPLLDLTPLRSRAVQVLLLASATAALGVYSPVFFLALQGYKEGLEDSALVLLQTFLGFATAIGCVGFGMVVVRPSENCRISRQYLCQISMVGIGASLLALGAVQGYHGYVLAVWLYGVCLGGFLYSLKMFTMQCVRSKYFTRAWGLVQGAEALPALLGVPITGYINQNHPKAGFYFSLLAALAAALLLFLCCPPQEPPPPVCVCPPMGALPSPPPRFLPKSYSMATALDCADFPEPPSDCYFVHPAAFRPLRASRSVPEGLAKQEWHRRHPVVVIEQMTTSV